MSTPIEQHFETDEEKKARLLDERVQSLGREQYAEDLRATLSTPEGRRFFYAVIDEHAGAYSSSFVADPLATAFREGQRAVGLTLLREAQDLAPEFYVLLMQERIAAFSMSRLKEL